MNAPIREPGREGSVVLGNPDRGVDVEPRLGPRQHASGLRFVEEFEADE